MDTASRLAFIALAGALAGTLAIGSALAQEGGEVTTFSRIEGGAVYDVRYSVDGSDVSQQYELIHVVCTDGSKSLRIMLPASPDDDGAVYDSNGPGSTLVKKGDGYQVTFRANGKDIVKSLELKPVNDPKSTYQAQFVVRADYGDPLWAALTSPKSAAAVMLIGQGGKPVSIAMDDKLRATLRSCGIKA